jgi:release factor glutamine methyltransferase
MTTPVSIQTALADSAKQLTEISESPRLDAELLVARSIDMPRSYLFAHPEDTIDATALERLQRTLEQRLSGAPLAYITGVKEFWSMELMVSPATLVPRPETELLVDLALREIPREAGYQVLDLGTGSGAVALAIANERQLCQITAVDISPDALGVAQQNARQLSISNVDFVEGDWTAPVADRRFNIVVSNPPYVASGDPALEALRAEPIVALSSGEDGLDSIRLLARDCAGIVENDGLILLEHGAEQRDLVADILLSYGWQRIQCYDDYSGKPRVTRAYPPDSEQR